MKRRKFVALTGSALAWPIAARAQQSAVPSIGFLSSRAQAEAAMLVPKFHEGLEEIGYVEGRNVTIEYRWAEHQSARISTLATDLVSRQVNVIVTLDTPAALAARAATSTIPIVFSIAADPVETGLVASLSQPGGNATGVTTLASELAPKQLQLLHEVLSGASSVALLVNPSNRNLTESTTAGVQSMARSLRLQLHVLNAGTEHELDEAFATLSQMREKFLVIGADAFFTGRVERLAALALRHAIPAVYWTRAFAEAGGLISYGTKWGEAGRVAGVYAGRILKGELPRNMPVQGNSTYDLFINLTTAKALGLTIPQTLPARADKVIE
jgi:putative ABC transport system substrate-binding protein